jgi:AcrR family transcriptional regulator
MPDPLTKGEHTSQAIVDAAYRLFVEQGFHATSMRQIARQAGLALGGIYNHFESKEEIFDRVLLEKHPYRQVLDLLGTAPGETAEEFVRNAAAAIQKELGARPEFLKLVFIEMSEFKGKHGPHLFQTIFPQFLLLAQRFIGASAQVRTDLPMQGVLFSFLGVLFSYYLTAAAASAAAEPTGPDPMQVYLEIFLHGILKAEKP